MPLNSDNILPPPANNTPGFYCGGEFAMGSGRAATERGRVSSAQPAVLVIGTRGLERVGPGADLHGASVVVKCKQATTGTLVFGSEIVGSCASLHDAPPLPPCESITWTFPLQNVVQYQFEAKAADTVTLASTKANPPVNALNGTWYREQPGMVISATFTHDELKLCMVQAADGDTATFTVTAHYTLTKDGLVYGAVTGTDADTKRDPGKPSNVPLSMDLAELAMTLQAFVDAPFSFRTKMTSAGLMVSGLKCGPLLDKSEANPFGGMFKFAKDGRVPAPVPLNTNTSKADVSLGAVVGTALGTAVGATIGNTGAADKLIPVPQAGTSPADCPRIGIDFNFNPPVMNPPKPSCDACMPPPARLMMAPPPAGTAPRTACEPAVPDTMKSLVSEAFGQLLQKSGQGGMTLPSPRYLEHYPQYFAPDPAFPLPRELAMQEDLDGAVRRTGATVPARPMASAEPLAKPGVVGTWYRDVAGKQCVVKVSPDHLTLSVSEAHEEDGKVSVASLVITADYHMTRDGVTAVGLITSVDVNFEGEFPQEDSKPFFEMLGELQKALEDKPFALTFRPYGDSLVVGNVRMPTVSDRMDVQPAGYMAGRYKNAGNKLPKPKVVKVTEQNRQPAPGLPGAPLPPSSAYPQPYSEPQPGGGYPQPYSVPTAPAPTGDLLPPQSLPAPRIVPSGGSWTAPQPTAPVPQMQPPTPPGSVREVVPTMSEPVKPVTSQKKVTPSSDLVVLMRQLLNQSEDLRVINNEWRRFWFNDQPSKLTPERTSGSIY
ncbi:hypothetical protein J8F10_35680 [Gemmata sp. G18]|uniref:Uncharacterized protein n=1 Tax=Gemmata palustris TaxID=2822762 RepID=A0ABS5C3Q6_9BACT|nr:hypothetical protein [Gemmata palustris]MBP3960595.1 hypothetical protein [Gemmata palustris]